MSVNAEMLNQSMFNQGQPNHYALRATRRFEIVLKSRRVASRSDHGLLFSCSNLFFYDSLLSWQTFCPFQFFKKNPMTSSDVAVPLGHSFDNFEWRISSD